MAVRILIVDDEPSIVNLIKAMTEPLGCEVLTTLDSRVAAKLIASKKFDGVILDIGMPHLDGFQLAQQIRTSASNHSVPIVMVTGNDDVQTQRLAFSLGVTLFLGKPITPKQVTGVINAMRGAFLREKRRYARLTLLTPVVCTWESKGPHRLEARSLDIAEQGMALMQVPGLGAGLQLDLEFMLPDSPERLQIRARVVRTMPPDGVGVAFVNLSPTNRERLQRYIKAVVTN